EFRRVLVRSCGSILEQISIAKGHLVLKLHPDGGFAGLGRSPFKMIRSRRSFVTSGSGTADNNACVYGCNGSVFNTSASITSTIFPRYMTAIRSLICLTTDKSWAMNR